MNQVQVDRGDCPVQGFPVAECPLPGAQEQWRDHQLSRPGSDCSRDVPMLDR